VFELDIRCSLAGFVSKEIEFWADCFADGVDSFDCNLSPSGRRLDISFALVLIPVSYSVSGK